MLNSALTTTLHVNPATGSDRNPGSALAPFKSLTQAISAIETAKTIIYLAPGTYNTANGEKFPLLIPGGVMVLGNEANKGKGIVIAGSGEFESEYFAKQNITLLLLDDAQLLGVTVTNTATKGTGIWLESSDPVVANSTLINCGREGVFVSGTSKPAIIDNVFVQNTACGLVLSGNSKGEILRNVFHQNIFGIAISDFAAPLVANNKLIDNRTAIALSRSASPVLRNNLIEKNSQGGLAVNGNAIPDLGNTQDPGENTFRDNGEFDLQNATSVNLISAGNQLNPACVKGPIDFLVTVDGNGQISSRTTFPDLEGHWATPFVEAVVNRGLMSGLPDGTFQPLSSISRAQYATAIAKAFQLPASNKGSKFTDVKPDFWAVEAINSVVSAGFLSGFPDDTFRPAQNMTKIQAIVSMVNGLKLGRGNPNVLTAYADRAQIPSYATDAVATATQKLLVLNYPQTELLEPLREITRAEVAALIYQALVAIGKEKAMLSPYIVNPPVNISSFTDLQGHWAEPFIRGLASMDLTQGYADGSYQPNQPMTRAQYAALIVKAFNPTPKRPATNFTDVGQDFWAYSAINQAAAGGFVGGFSDRTFRPHQNVQRLQVIVSLVNGLGLPAALADGFLSYSDKNAIPDFARAAVATATLQKIVVNHPDPKLIEPNREATRAEVAAMVYQALVAIKRTPPINSAYVVSSLTVRQ